MLLLLRRMMFSFARSRALPFSRFFNCLDQRNHMPIRAVWLAVLLACAMGTLLLVPGSEFFGDMISYGFAGLQLAHGLPILCRLTISRHSFEPGPIHLGKYSSIIGWISVAWTIVSLVRAHFLILQCVRPTDCTARSGREGEVRMDSSLLQAGLKLFEARDGFSQ